MALTKEDIATLSKPFDRKTIGVKVNSLSQKKDKALLVLYIQHTDAYSRIEEVDPAWSFEVLGETKGEGILAIHGKLTIKGVPRSNYGEGQDPKSATSDAIKRCAMLFGVARYLYDTETVWVPYNEATDKYKRYTLDDFEKALRPGQEKPLTSAAGAKVTQAIKAGEAFRPTALEQPAAKPRTRQDLAAEITRVYTAMGVTTADANAWAQEVSGKAPNQMTLVDMEAFLNTLLGECGRNGIAV